MKTNVSSRVLAVSAALGLAAGAGSAAQTPILVSGELENPHAVVLAFGGRFAL